MNTGLAVGEIRSGRGLEQEINKAFNMEVATKPNPLGLAITYISFPSSTYASGY
jgi:hypothetical protein